MGDVKLTPAEKKEAAKHTLRTVLEALESDKAEVNELSLTSEIITTGISDGFRTTADTGRRILTLIFTKVHQAEVLTQEMLE